eukprot:SAG22_NODE_20582_length_264_cov_0.939394_1_plen_63_part_01
MPNKTRVHLWLPTRERGRLELPNLDPPAAPSSACRDLDTSRTSSHPTLVGVFAEPPTASDLLL